MAFPVNFLLILSLSLVSSHGSLADSLICPRSDLDSFIGGIRSQCPLWIDRSSPDEVSGDQLDRELGYVGRNAYRSIFLYATWCPFSKKLRPVFDALSSMFPQIRHVAIEESSATPSLFSRYGIHSFPSILIAKGTTKVQYHGLKDLDSLVKFYKETTGLEPVAYISVEQPPITGSETSETPFSPRDNLVKEIITKEPYLAYSLLFILLRVFVSFFPVFIYRIKAFLAMYSLHLNLGFFGEWRHLLEKVAHVIDLKKLWSKLRLSNKTGNFHKGAKNARVWASSLASVSLGESSSSRDS